MEKYESSDGVATTEFKRLRNFIYIQREEIAKLKLSLADLNEHDDEITGIETTNQELSTLVDARINKLVDENNELKAALNLAVTKPMQPLINLRFKENKIVRHCLNAGGTDLNKLSMMDFSVEDREQFAQLIGYSLGGYAELSYVTDESYYRAEKQSKGKS